MPYFESESEGGNRISRILLEEELKFNPFLKFNESTYLNSIGIEDLDEVKNFEKIRVLKDNF